ncbi:acetate/propionate family kinase [Phaeobacter sp. 22II1-1F12B]|uniref:acetate/propionate family kinase n=1 Tax=Phaeobacter sp. 22II1-1F12B TaxID=1317111 RepID=UPI000B5278A6|nr:acetate/propionate family kinase [Phaeobacter sp. 22II1-1F12B]OWU81047.1 acetate kinase [Phaeobacter sp. 22II1-1F12B]
MSAILTLNAGSSSIKFAVYLTGDGDPELLYVGQVENIGGAAELKLAGDTPVSIGAKDHETAVQAILTAVEPLLEGRQVAGVGHRIVHGGPDLGEPARLSPETLAMLEKLVPLAPLHQPHNLAAVRAAQVAFPGAVQIGCFDTAFHRGKPFVNDAYGLPLHFYEQGIRRYGFHGLSYDYIAGELRRTHPEIAKRRVVVAHLGNGASLCGLLNGKSIATTMGFSALDGLVMGTRPGQLDPGVMLYLMDQGMSSAELTRLLYHDSGLKGLSGIGNDMRELLASQSPDASQALEYYVARLRREIGSMAAALGGIDGLVFSGGVGENAAEIRARVVEGLGFLGLSLDQTANQQRETRIGDGKVDILVIPTNEELVIARSVADHI